MQQKALQAAQVTNQRTLANASALPFISPHGFREYDARWWYGFAGDERSPEINLAGIQAVGAGLAHMLRMRGIDPAIIVGHDLRSYSAEVKAALITGLVSGGAQVLDIGLVLSPIAYFARTALDVCSVAVVTASHNENGWTGIKMGCEPPYTFGENDMAELQAIVLDQRAQRTSGGSYSFIDGVAEHYSAALTQGRSLQRRLKVAVVCGNGTAGLFAPQILRAIGCDVVEVDCTPDWDFPHYNPDPESAPMQEAMVQAVKAHGADLAFGFDGDGDRCGVADDEGNIIYADRLGLLLAREISRKYNGARFIVDVKSTSLFQSDPVLAANGASVEYWKTGHSHIKRRLGEVKALAGFEKSGHFFFCPPLGGGYDDGLAAAIVICEMLAACPQHKLSDLHRQLPVTYATPTLSIRSGDQQKYSLVAQIEAYLSALAEAGGHFAGQAIAGLLTVNGVRIALPDGSWGLIRASSNKPELVIVAESPVSALQRDAIVGALKRLLEVAQSGCPLGEIEETQEFEQGNIQSIA